jgi:hypothetical protein
MGGPVTSVQNVACGLSTTVRTSASSLLVGPTLLFHCIVNRIGGVFRALHTRYELDTSLLFAAQHGKAYVVKPLVEAKADVNVKERCGKTVLMLSALEGKE